MAISNAHITILTLNVKIQPKPNGMLHPDPFHMQGYTKTQNKGMEEDLPTKWRAKANKQINK